MRQYDDIIIKFVPFPKGKCVKGEMQNLGLNDQDKSIEATSRACKEQGRDFLQQALALLFSVLSFEQNILFHHSAGSLQLSASWSEFQLDFLISSVLRYLFYFLKESVWLASVLFWLFSFPGALAFPQGAFPFSDHSFVFGFHLRPDVSVIRDQEYSLMELSRFRQSPYHSGFRKGYF